jgi:hypothetical protein
MRGEHVRKIEIYVKEIRGAIHVIGLLPGKDLFDLGSCNDPQKALAHALDYARLLDVDQGNVHLFGQTVTELMLAGLLTAGPGVTVMSPCDISHAGMRRRQNGGGNAID